MNKRNISLAALARESVQAVKTGATHANLAAEAMELTSEERAALNQRALVDPETKQALEWASEAREATFTDAFARASYFRLKIQKLAEEDKPDPEMVLATFFSARGTKFRVRGKDGLQPAIPLFRGGQSRHEARRFHPRPIATLNSFRKKENGREHIGSRGLIYVIPMTASDHDAFEQMRKLLDRMPQILLEHLESMKSYDIRQAAWLALHFIPRTQVLSVRWFERLFSEKDGAIFQRDSGHPYLRYDLSQDEIVVMPKNDVSERLIARLGVFFAEKARMIGKK